MGIQLANQSDGKDTCGISLTNFKNFFVLALYISSLFLFEPSLPHNFPDVFHTLPCYRALSHQDYWLVFMMEMIIRFIFVIQE